MSFEEKKSEIPYLNTGVNMSPLIKCWSRCIVMQHETNASGGRWAHVSFEFLVYQLTCVLFSTSHNSCQLLRCACQLTCIYFLCKFLHVKRENTCKSFVKHIHYRPPGRQWEPWMGELEWVVFRCVPFHTPTMPIYFHQVPHVHMGQGCFLHPSHAKWQPIIVNLCSQPVKRHAKIWPARQKTDDVKIGRHMKGWTLYQKETLTC